MAQQRRSVRKCGGGAGAANSSQFKVVDVANSVTRRASLIVMCLFTGFSDMAIIKSQILPCPLLFQTPVDISGNDS